MAQILKIRWSRWRSEDGAQLVEFALVLPLLLLVVLGIAEFGFIFQRYEVLTNAAREGARIAVLPGYSDADVQARVAAYVTAGRVPTTGTNPNVAVTSVPIPTTPGGPVLTGKRVTVTYTHSYMFLTGIGSWFGASYTTVPLIAVSEMRTEIAAGL
jgi:Flp pilus assembly protein TadG